MIPRRYDDGYPAWVSERAKRLRAIRPVREPPANDGFVASCFREYRELFADYRRDFTPERPEDRPF